MLSSYPGTVEPGTTQVIFDDKPAFYDEKLLDGRTRRYSVVSMYVVSISPRSFAGVTDIVEQSLTKLGYSDLAQCPPTQLLLRWLLLEPA